MGLLNDSEVSHIIKMYLKNASDEEVQKLIDAIEKEIQLTVYDRIREQRNIRSVA